MTHRYHNSKYYSVSWWMFQQLHEIGKLIDIYILFSSYFTELSSWSIILLFCIKKYKYIEARGT